MGFRLNDFECMACGHLFEELHKGEDVPCPECKSDKTEKLIATPNLATMNMLSKEDYATKMRKRSSDHTAKLVAKEGVNGQAVRDLRKS